MSIDWNKTCEEQFSKILEKIPALIRPIAEIRVSKKAVNLVSEDNRHKIEEKDMVDAFFAETPPDFVPQMKVSMAELDIDYTQYGYDK